jgi:hypothetical protein
VVPRSWALVWLTQAHREPPSETPAAWRRRWSEAAEVARRPGPLEALIDAPATVAPDPEPLVRRNLEVARDSLAQAVASLAGQG